MNDIFDTVAGFLTDPVIKIPNRRFIPDCLTQVVCTGRNLSYLGCKTDYIVGGSINFNYEQSLAGALGEFVERYAAGLYHEEEFVTATYDELKNCGGEKEKAGVSDLRIPVWKWEEIPGKIW